MTRTATQTVTFEWNGKECGMVLHADMVKDDFGVAGSPVWWSPNHITVGKIYIDATEYKNDIMFAADFGKDALDEINEITDELMDEDEWVMDEEPDERCFDEY